MDVQRQGDGLLVIGAGLMRTGTNSLQFALQRVLNGKCYHMHTIIENPHQADFWLKACFKDPSDQEWRDFLADYKAAVDAPPVCFYKQLMRVYPNAKVVLTVRDPERWFHSVSTTIGPALKSMEAFPMNVIAKISGMSRMLNMIGPVTCRVLGPDFDMFNKQRMIASFNSHVEEVKRVVPADRLLVFEAKDGWEPLCNFLGVDVPDEPYPHVNTADEMLTRIRKMKIASTCSAVVTVLLVSGVGYLAYRVAAARDWIPSALLQLGINKEL